MKHLKRNIGIIAIVIVVTAVLLLITQRQTIPHIALHDPLPSWQNGEIKKSIIHFVNQVTDKSNPNYVAPDKRIATIDNDGTLWVEQPIYTQAFYMFDQFKRYVKEHPTWKPQAKLQGILTGDNKAIANLTAQDLTRILALTNSGMSVEAFHARASEWLRTAKHPRFQRPFIELVYQPMIEVINYLRANDFAVYIVTGGGQDFVRAYSTQTYKVLPENIIGSMTRTKYVYQNNKPQLIKVPEVFLIDDKTGKPVAINMFIGLKPIIAFGNSDGDREMLEWTQSSDGPKLMLLVQHDDAKREYAYGPNSKIGTFSPSLMAEASKQGWKVISMKNDWKRIFSFE